MNARKASQCSVSLGNLAHEFCVLLVSFLSFVGITDHIREPPHRPKQHRHTLHICLMPFLIHPYGILHDDPSSAPFFETPFSLS